MERQTAGREPAFRFSPRSNRAAEIQWQGWGDAAFRKAQAEDKPVLLAISAVWCHWCHVMDETTYSDQLVIDTINGNYVAIRVDNDRRPDVNRRYNQGGWPTAAFLTPTGELLWGGTYIPPEQMRSVLRQVSDYYRANSAEVRGQVAERWKHREQQAPMAPAAGELSEAIPEAVVTSIRDSFDQVYGGFGTEPKFPNLPALQFALERYYHTADASLAEVVRLTLEWMQKGGVFDQVAGGFFRYSTTRNWGIPHYEKMLEDNAGLLRLYLNAYKVFSEDSFRVTAEKVSHYLLNTLYDAGAGVFYGSQDADEDYYTVDAAGRVQREAPFVDRTIYVDWNAQTASAYADAYCITGDAKMRQVALRAVDFLWERCYRPDLGMYHYWDGRPQRPGLLGDQVTMLLALVDAHEISGNPTYLDRAEELSALLLAQFAAPEGGFYDLARDEVERIGLLRVTDRNADDNARAAEGLRRLSIMSGNEQYAKIAEETLRSFVGEAAKQGLFAAGYASAVERLRRAPTHLVVVGDRRDVRTADLFWESTKVYEPGKVAQLVEPDSNRLAALGYPATPAPVAYVCVNYTCLPPIRDAHEVQAAVRRVKGRESGA